MKNRPEIDGLRAVSVLAVLLFHADIGVSGGYVGVDVFFVISGYLITSLILRELESGQFRMFDFWERRIRRILPALFIVILGTLGIGWFVFLAQDFQELGDSVVAQVFLRSNVFFWLKSGYFEQPAELRPLLHTWSLALEEQFYLVFPILLVAQRRYSRKSPVTILVILCVLSFGISVYGSYEFPWANFYLLPTRAWELLIGSILAAIPRTEASHKRLNEVLCWGGLLSILCAALICDRTTRFPGVTALLPCLGAALVLWTTDRTQTSAGRFLSARPLVLMGLISYSLYLWHWPLLVFARYCVLGQLTLVQRSLVLIVSVLLAALSTRFVETPFRKRTVLKSRTQIFTFAGVAACVVLVMGLTIVETDGVRSRIPPQAQQYADGSTDRAFLNELTLDDAAGGNFVELGMGDKSKPVKLLVWGDSHAMAAVPVLDFLCREHLVRGVQATHSVTAPLVGYQPHIQSSLNDDCIAFNDAVVEYIRNKHVSDVLLVAFWDMYLKTDKGSARLNRSIAATVKILTDAGARVWIMKDVPGHSGDIPRILASTVLTGGNPEEIGTPLDEHLKVSHREDAIFEGLPAPNVAILDPTDYFVIHKNLCHVAAGGRALYCDKNHLTVYGSMLLRPLFEPIFENTKNKTNQPALTNATNTQVRLETHPKGP